MCDMTRSHVCHDLFTCVPCLFSWGDMRRYLKIAITSLHIGTMTRSRVCLKLFTCVTWYIHMCAMTYPQVWLVLSAEAIFSHVWHDCFTFVTWLVHHDSSTCVYKMRRHETFSQDCEMTSLHIGTMTRAHVCHDSQTCWGDMRWYLKISITSLHIRPTTLLHVYYDLFACVPWLVYLCAMTSRLTRKNMGWLRFVGSLKL